MLLRVAARPLAPHQLLTANHEQLEVLREVQKALAVLERRLTQRASSEFAQ